MHDMLKRKNNIKSKTNQNALNMVASVFLGDVGVIGYTLKVIIPMKQL